jgi:transcriptional regulator with XRE-family HTH domain
MISISHEETNLLKKLGVRLRKARIKRGDTQEQFGARVDISRNIISQMEHGDPAVAFGRWLKAASCVGLLDTFALALFQEENPFEQYDKEQKGIADIMRTRVRRK